MLTRNRFVKVMLECSDGPMGPSLFSLVMTFMMLLHPRVLPLPDLQILNLFVKETTNPPPIPLLPSSVLVLPLSESLSLKDPLRAN